MNRLTITLSIAAAFAAGCGVTHLLRPAYAAETIAAQVIHTGELEGDAISHLIGFTRLPLPDERRDALASVTDAVKLYGWSFRYQPPKA